MLLAACSGASQSSPAPRPEQPAPPPPQAVPGAESDPTMVAPTVLATYRIEGSNMIVPDDEDKVRMVERGLNRVIATTKLCLAASGEPSSVTIVGASGLPSYDEKIRQHISAWRYKPFEINGKPAPVCTTVTIIYNQTRR